MHDPDSFPSLVLEPVQVIPGAGENENVEPVTAIVIAPDGQVNTASHPVCVAAQLSSFVFLHSLVSR